jgi:phage-related protein
VIAIAALVAGVIYAWNHFEGFRDAVMAVWKAIKGAVEAVVNWFTGTFVPWVQMLAASFMQAWTTVKDFFVGLWNGIRDFFVGIWTGISDWATALWNSLVSAFTTVWNYVSGVWNAIWKVVAYFFTEAWNGIKAVADVIWGAISAAFTLVWNAVSAAWEAIWTVVSTVFKFYWDIISGAAKAIWGVISSFFTTAWDALSRAWDAIWNVISTVFSTVWNVIKTVATTVWNAISTFFTAAWQALSAAWSAIWNVISSVFSTVWNAIKAVAVAVWNAISDFFSGAFNAFGNFFSGVWDGIKNVFSTVWNAIKTVASTVWNSIVDFFRTAFTNFTSFFTGVWNGIKQAFSDAFGGIKDIAQRIWDDVKGIFSGAINLVIKVPNWIIDKINDIFGTHISRIQDFHFANGGNVDQPGFANGGGLAGRISGIGGQRGDRVPAMLSPEEHVWSAREVRGAGGHQGIRKLREAARKGVLSGFADGGLVKRKEIPAFTPGAYIIPEEIAKRAAPFLGALRAGQPEAMQATGGRYAKIAVKGRRFFGDGGFARLALGGTTDQALKIARSMAGTPYVWGGVSASGADCSGFQSIITNALLGQTNPYHRVGTTASFPWGGFTRGAGTPNTGYTVGNTYNAFNSGVGHMAGTLAGHNVESGSGHGPMVDGSALGANASLFTMQGFLEGAGGPGKDDIDWGAVFDGMAGWIKKDAHGLVDTFVSGVAPMFADMAHGQIDSAWSGVRDYVISVIKEIEEMVAKAVDFFKNALSSITFGLFDNGGWLQPGLTVAMNKTGKPEMVMSDPVTMFDRMITRAQQAPGSGGGGGTIEAGAITLSVTVQGNADTVTVRQLEATLNQFGDAIMREYTGRT